MTRRAARRWKRQQGRLWIEDDTLCQESMWCSTWRLPISKIRAIAEETNPHGPVGEDWLVAIFTGIERWHNASTQANGVRETLLELATRLDCPLETTLVGSTDFASRVMYPAHLAEHPAFEYHPVTRSGPGRLLEFLLPQNQQIMAPELKQHLMATHPGRNTSPDAEP